MDGTSVWLVVRLAAIIVIVIVHSLSVSGSK
jgi:hypothetical protein